MRETKDGEIIETAEEASGGEPGPSIRNVLVISLTLVIVAFAIIYFYYF